MNNQPKKVIITASILPKADEKMRLRAVREKLSLGELLEKYQSTYDEKEKEKKEHNRLKREYEAGGKVKCPFCGKIAEKN